MKKSFLIFLVGLLVVVLSACNSTAEPVSGDNTEKNPTEQPEVSELTLEEVYEKAIERQNELTSVSADMKLDQTMTLGSGEESLEMATKSDMVLDMVIDPLAMYMDGTMLMANPQSGEDVSIDVEMYMNQQGMFTFDSESKKWLKLPVTDFEAMMGQTANQVNAAEQLAGMKSFINEFKFEQTNDAYVLTLNAAGDKFSEYIVEQMQINQMLGTTEDQQLFESMKFDKVDYVITINKKTFDITAMDMVLDFTIDMEGESMSISNDTKVAFNNFDGVEAITVPQEVIDQAVEVQY
ncbi:hypothetical protein QUF56_19790 [Ureibacillus composti]|nr:hypothetical protein [Ureibacillus composti]